MWDSLIIKINNENNASDTMNFSKTYLFCGFPAKNVQPKSNHEEILDKPNWGIVYKITGLSNSKFPSQETQNKGGRTVSD